MHMATVQVKLGRSVRSKMRGNVCMCKYSGDSYKTLLLDQEMQSRSLQLAMGGKFFGLKQQLHVSARKFVDERMQRI